MNSRNAIVCALVAAAGTTAAAGVFTWTGGHLGDWNVAANWSGPGGLYPRLTIDTATISGVSNSARLNSNTALAQLNVLDGASVYSSGHSLFVDGNVYLGSGSSLSVTETPSLRDFDADTLTLAGGALAMYGGLAQIDESLVIGSPTGGAVLGVGTIEMNSTTGNLVIGKGGLWAMSGAGPETTLLIDRTDSSTSRLDWSDPESDIIVWEGKTIHNRLPYTGSLGGEISVSNTGGSSRFLSDEGFIAAASSELSFNGTDDVYTSQIEAPFVDSYGEITVSGRGRLDAAFVGLRGNGEIAEDGWFIVDTPAMLWDSFSFAATGPNTKVWFSGPDAAVSVTGGATVFDLGETGFFDLDGLGNMEMLIADGSSLEIRAGHIDLVEEDFGGTLNLEGALHIEAYSLNSWSNSGTINMEGGDYSGRTILNNWIIRGEGDIDAHVINEGVIEAVGSTLVLASLDLDGIPSIPGTGVVRAEQGDLVVMTPPNNITYPFYGKMFVGNGAGPREVFEFNDGVSVSVNDEGTGSLTLDGGFARFGSLSVRSAFASTGDSVLVLSGAGGSIDFHLDSGTASIEDTLEVRGRAVIDQEIAMSGDGTIDMSMTNKNLRMRDGADTAGVSIATSGGIQFGSFFDSGTGQAATAGLTMRPTARMDIDIAGDAASGDFDRLDVAGDALVDGTLVVRWSADLGDAPVGETYTVLTADSVSGAFDSVDFGDLGVNRRAHATVHPDRVDVFVTCLTDLNADGVLDLSDINGFVDAFTGGEELADIAPPFGVLDLNDLNAFVFFFQGGCN